MNYPQTTLQRAHRAIACSPFLLGLFVAMQQHGISLPEIAGPQGVARGYAAQIVSERSAERSLLWLIQVGLLRREVDGQGLTNSFRLTPLGRLLVEKWQQQGDRFRRISWGDRLWDLGHQILSGVI